MKPITKKEFEFITKKDLSESNFNNLIKFVGETLEQNKEETNKDKNTGTSFDFYNITYKKGYGQVINLKNYVGVIQTKDVQIEVLPKIQLATSDVNNIETKKIFYKMLACLKDSNHEKIFDNANLDTYNLPIFEFLISQYIKKVFNLIKRGLKSDYIRVEDNMPFLKGKLLFKENIRYNMFHKERFYVAYDEYSLNRAENRIIKSTLLKLQKLTHNNNNYRDINKLLMHFEFVEPSQNIEKDLAKAETLDRTIYHYKSVINWSKIFLKKRGFTNFSGDTDVDAFLFPMEKIFEDYIATKIKQLWGNEFEITAQDTEFDFLEIEHEQNKTKGVFPLRPDIVLKKDNKTIIMDTKWKVLENKQFQYGISQPDLYQMVAYGLKYNANDIFLLYPQTEDKKLNELDIKYYTDYKNKDILKSNNITIHIHFIDLENTEGSLNKLKESILFSST
ncbi:MAG: McrC family protein [Abditibacteriota bacterium]|nr:McrC family protein [Abditibacteriota bacterium]